jgi:hypothetical protein
MTRRVVRFSELFFASLDEQLPAERPGDGQPSVSDFLVFDVPTLFDRLAEDFEGCTTSVPPGHKVRAYIGGGVLVSYFVAYAIIRSDDVVEVVDIEIEP